MTAGQVPLAATASTVTSSFALGTGVQTVLGTAIGAAGALAKNNEIVFNAADYGWTADGTDHSTEALALLTIVNTAGGGTIYFPPAALAYRADSQLLIPNDAASIPAQKNIRFTGAGGGQSWGDVARTQKGAATLDLRYTVGDGNAKIESRGTGSLQIDNLTLTDGGASNATPFIHTTNTTLSIHENTFIGSGSATQDGVVLGGASNQTPGSGVTAPFQGYGTVINANVFRRMNRGIYGRTFANSVVVTNNAWVASTGTIAIEFAAATGNLPDKIFGLVVTGNIIEMSDPMIHGIVLQAVTRSYFANSFYDQVSTYLSDYHLVRGSDAGGLTSLNTFVDMVSGGVRLTQLSDAVQLTLQTLIGSSGVNNIQGDGVASSIFAKGLEASGSWTGANAAAGTINIRDEFNPTKLMAMGVDGGTNVAHLDAWSSGGNNISMDVQPRGGPFTINGPTAYKPTALALANGLNSNKGLWAADATNKSSYIRVTGPTGGFSLGGMSNQASGTSSVSGSQLHIYNATSQVMTIVNEDASSTATNRIKTLTGADVVLRGGTSMASFIYDDTDTRWILVSTN